ncbi:MAG: hypothetical protein K8L97_11905 [Anaerolineae bacterium]|nr:hypothetical protein [Anaerolineae bacterium]
MDIYVVWGLLSIILLAVTVILFWNLRKKVLVLRSDLMRAKSKYENDLASQKAAIESVIAIATHQFGPPYYIEGLTGALTQGNPILVHAAEEMLIQGGSESIKPLVTATKRAKIPLSVAIPVLMRCAKSENDLLVILNEHIDQTEMCEEILKHPYANERILNHIANKGPLSILTILVSMPVAQGTTAQKTAQQRLKETAVDEDSSDSGYTDDDDRATGTCDCRWR